MGCIAGLGRCVLIAVNSASALVAIALIVCGCVIKFLLSDLLRTHVVDVLSKAVFELFVDNTPVPDSVDFGLFTDTVGTVLIVIGALLLAISIIGCCAACCSFRCLLIIFCVLIGTLVIGQVVFYAVILPENSAAHDSAKDSLARSLKTEYNRHHVNSFTISADIIFLATECCGVNNPEDFKNNPNLSFNFSNQAVVNPLIPPSCCQHQYIKKLDWSCANDYSKGYTKGCYKELQDVVASWYPWLIPAIVITLLVQCGEIVAAIMIYKDDNNAII